MSGFFSLMTDKMSFEALGSPGAVQVHKADLSTIRLNSSANPERIREAASLTGVLVVSRKGEEITLETLEELRVGDHLAIRIPASSGTDEAWELGTILDIP
ncbi:MAG: hypothetical protein BWY43_00688 [candidate division WS2 bacterium ADurb.Bin280]|uniref:Uncharacterized protein n=1 Tax=candidate division WS2 bacterium ADurb.Bin280 TaxID=1852829 RepID=A0A1V5SBY9_9BACT|nr:MAG: hypothetical protein BWY43_00688 [candidate division WS2 bacterium ADurb.Bin280]